MSRQLLPCLSFLLLLACAPADESVELGRVESTLTARRDAFTLSVRTSVSADGISISGRASSALEFARAFVPDDEIGTTTVEGQRFVTVLPLSELTGRLLGSPLFLSMRTVDGHQEFARLDLELDLPASCATSRMRFSPGSANVLIDGVPMVRFAGTTSLQGARPSARIGASDEGPVWSGHRSGARFWIDVPVDLAATAALTETPIRFTVQSGATRSSRSCVARPIPRALALTLDDPYDVWPIPLCDEALKSCLARRSHQSDTSACGDTFTVSTCGPRPLPQRCGDAAARKLANTVAGSFWLSETDAAFAPVMFASDGTATTPDALRQALALPDGAELEVRSLDEVLAWPAHDEPTLSADERLRAAHFRTLFRQLSAWLSDVKVVRVGQISIAVYFVGKDACGNIVGLSTLAVET
jgi:hypothetical protein